MNKMIVNIKAIEINTNMHFRDATEQYAHAGQECYAKFFGGI